MPILIIGGANYTGSHMVQLAHRAGFAVVMLDDLFSGHAGAVPDQAEVETLAGSLADRALHELFTPYCFAAVLPVASVGQESQPPGIGHDQPRCLGLGAEISMDSRTR